MELVDAVTHAFRPGPELARERRGEAQVRVEDVQRPSASVDDAQVRADPRLLAILEAAHVVVRDPVRLASIVLFHAEV